VRCGQNQYRASNALIMDNRRFSILVLLSAVLLFAGMQVWQIKRETVANTPQNVSIEIDSVAPQVAPQEQQQQDESEAQLPQFAETRPQLPEPALPVPQEAVPLPLPQVDLPQPVEDFSARLPDNAIPLPDIATSMPEQAESEPAARPQARPRPSAQQRSARATAAAPRRSGVPALLAPISKPPYPDSARRKGLEGTVCLQAIINEQGQIMAVTITQSSGYAVLDKCAREHFKSVARFRAGCPGRVSVPFEFKLQ